MFQWTTTTILNSLSDFTAKNDEGEALDLVKVFKDGTKFPGASNENPILKIKRDHTFESKWVRKVYRALAKKASLCLIKINMDTVVNALKPTTGSVTGDFRFYIALEGSEESIYANDWYQKGKPFGIGFTVATTTTGKQLADAIASAATKYGVKMYGKKIFELKSVADGGTNYLLLTGTHEYQRIYQAAFVLDDGAFSVPVVEFDAFDVTTYNHDADKPYAGAAAVTASAFDIVKRGTNGFGTYSQIVKDLRLPTAHHNKWLKLKEDETPIVGAEYNQYIISYCAPSLATPGFSIIGQEGTSLTTHVFWVKKELDAEFLQFLKDAKIPVETVGYGENGPVNQNTTYTKKVDGADKTFTIGEDLVEGTEDDKDVTA